jgi:hypothetical protein
MVVPSTANVGVETTGDCALVEREMKTRRRKGTIRRGRCRSIAIAVGWYVNDFRPQGIYFCRRWGWGVLRVSERSVLEEVEALEGF